MEEQRLASEAWFRPGSLWSWVTVAAVVVFLGVDWAQWTFIAWDAARPDADSLDGLFWFAIFSLLAALWGLADGLRNRPWLSVALKWAIVALVLSLVDARYDQGDWLRRPEASFLVNLAGSGLAYLFIIWLCAMSGWGIGTLIRSEAARWRYYRDQRIRR